MARRSSGQRYRVNFGTGEVTPQTFGTQSEAERWMTTAKRVGRDPAARLYFVEHFDPIAGWLPTRGRAHAAKKTRAQLDREIAEALRGRVSHATKSTSTSGRWSHRSVAQALDVPEDVVRRIYAAVQTAKKQGLYGGHTADFIERSVGRKLVGGEYDVAARAKKHLAHDPPGGYGGPQPTGAAKEPPRPKYGESKIESAAPFVSRADRIIKDVLSRRRHPTFGWDWSNDAKDRDLLRQAAEELDVAADLYEDAGANVRAGTLHERARHARQGNYQLLAAYD